ncbi:MAG TPA: MucB/RseB C-terminal domain-containing protein [Methylophilaceae bacterium]|nr:MucB/RseB C-terminal domain-containing protein [Methylophilaceae bacterium]
MKRLLLACLLAAQASFAYADDPWQLLQNAADASRNLSYRGIFVYQSGKNSRSVQLTHMNYGQGEYARSIVLDGSPREVLSQGSDLVIYSPRNEKVVITKRRAQNLFPALLPANMEEIKESYQARLGGEERVGGREGQIIFLDSRDQYRYGYKFWTDKQYGLILKSMTFNEKNEPIEQITFTQLTLLDTHNMDWFQPTVDPAKRYVMEEEETVASVDTSDLSIDPIPAGFHKIDQVQRMVPGKPVPVTHLIFSDGLASVSLFIERLNKMHPPKLGHRMVGSTNFYIQATDGYQVVAVGEVPAATVTQMANAVKFKKQ